MQTRARVYTHTCTHIPHILTTLEIPLAHRDVLVLSSMLFYLQDNPTTKPTPLYNKISKQYCLRLMVTVL